MRNSKIISLILVLCMLQTNEAQVEYPYYVPNINKMTRINIELLPLAMSATIETVKVEEIVESYSHRVEEFVVESDIEGSCRSVIKEGIECIELENTQIGYQKRPENYGFSLARGYFKSLDSWGAKSIQVFFDTKKNHFYIRPSRSFPLVFGAFLGDPLITIKKAEFTNKERNTFSGVTLKYRSKRWEFTKEEAMVSRDSNYDFVGGRRSGREIESMRLQSQFFRFRLQNNSGKDLFYLNKDDAVEPFHLVKFREWNSWIRQAPQPFYGYQDYYLKNLNWVSLPNNAEIEFETRAGCDMKQICAVGVYLNDERTFWDVVEIIALYPSNKSREFSKKNQPPIERIPEVLIVPVTSKIIEKSP